MKELQYRANREPLVPPGGVDCHVRDMTATVSADVSLSELQTKLAKHGQRLPIDGESGQSMGTLVSTDSTGPLRLGYGAWRDLLLGVQFTNGRGELITAGGRTVKNVAGYDLTKFMVGQRGIFGRLVTVTTRTYRRPAAALLARYSADPGLLGKWIASSLRPQWAILTREALLCGYLGDEPTIDFYQSAVGGAGPAEVIRRTVEQDIAHRQELWHAPGPVVFRASVPPASLKQMAESLEQYQWSVDAAFGIVLGSCEREAIASIREAASRAGGTARFFDGPFGAALELSTSPAERQIIERLKRAFDPDNNLDPLPWRMS
jgi:glycolate oxidase FAD binding subunit